MIHPVRAWLTDPLSVGALWGAAAVMAGAVSLLPASFFILPTWTLIVPLVAIIAGAAVITLSLVRAIEIGRGNDH